MIVYLAGKPEDHSRFNEYARDLRSRNIQVVSTWHQSGAMAGLLDRYRQRRTNQRVSVEELFAGKDINPRDPRLADASLDAPLEEALQRCNEEIKQADWFIADLDGGAMEAGFALASGKQTITMGTVQSPLSVLFSGQAKAVETWPQVLVQLGKERGGNSFVDLLREF